MSQRRAVPQPGTSGLSPKFVRRLRGSRRTCCRPGSRPHRVCGLASSAQKTLSPPTARLNALRVASTLPSQLARAAIHAQHMMSAAAHQVIAATPEGSPTDHRGRREVRFVLPPRQWLDQRPGNSIRRSGRSRLRARPIRGFDGRLGLGPPLSMSRVPNGFTSLRVTQRIDAEGHVRLPTAVGPCIRPMPASTPSSNSTTRPPATRTWI